MQKLLTALLVLVFGVLAIGIVKNGPDLLQLPIASEYYTVNTVEETGALNMVSAILFDFRGYDSLFEITILFAATTGVSALFAHRTFLWSTRGMSLLTKTALRWHIPFIFLFGLYLLMFGHLSPGGGFQGGVILATISIVLSVVYGTGYDRAKLSPTLKRLAEAGGALLFLLLGVVGIVSGEYYLANLSVGFDIGTVGEVYSSGTIFWLNIFSGLKVAGGLGIIFYAMIKEDKEYLS